MWGHSPLLKFRKNVRIAKKEMDSSQKHQIEWSIQQKRRERGTKPKKTARFLEKDPQRE